MAGVGTVRRLRGKEARTVQDMLNLAVKRYFTVVFPLLIAASAAGRSVSSGEAGIGGGAGGGRM